MSKKASKTLIGAFVLGAVVLIVAGVVVFGGGKFFAPTKKYVMFFEGSVKGLQVGAPVIFRGVKIGEVFDIRLDFHPGDLTADIPVYIEIDPRLLNIPEEFKRVLKEREKYWFLKPLIDKGLKAQLQMQSFVTGQLAVSLDFYPDKPIRLRGLEKKYPEIPTVPTGLEELTRIIRNLPLGEITMKLDSVLAGLEKVVQSPELTGSIASLNQALKDISAVAKNIDKRLGPLTASLTSTSDAARGAFVQAEKSLKMDEGTPGEIAYGIRDTLKESRLALEAARKALEGIQQIAEQNTNLGYEINRSLEQMNATSRSLRSLTDYLDRHPEALIRGKNPSKGE